ncbi:MAG: sensor histidine kinase [Gemmatimonadetes bacterium]|nr:sensor histidine kinase [Gemmatimonadota bacterium]
MIHYLPTVYSNRQGFECLGELAKATEDLFADRLELNMSQVWSFDANMAAPLGAILAQVADKFNTVEIVAIPDEVEQVLRKNRFLTNYWYESLNDIDRITMPFRRLRLRDEGEFEEYIHRQLSGRGIPRMSERASRVFKKKVFEVYQNAVVHSESELGVFVCGQFFPQQHRLDFTIADVGIGIREAVRRYFNDTRISSLPALKWALKPYHTTKSGPHPGGLGLEFLQKFARLNKGKIQIASRFGFYELNCDKETFEGMAADLPGTAVTIGINTADEGVYVLKSEIDTDDVS